MKVLTFTRLNLGAYIGPRYKRYRNLDITIAIGVKKTTASPVKSLIKKIVC